MEHACADNRTAALKVEKLTSEDVHLLEAEAVLGKALKRLEQGGRQQALAAQEMLSFAKAFLSLT